MNDILHQRFWLLFSLYGIDGNAAVVHTKQKIIDYANAHPDVLRGDAALFLLSNIDNMLIRSRVIRLPFANASFPFSKAAQPIETPEENLRGVDLILDDIFSVIDRREDLNRPISAHDIMRISDSIWDLANTHLPWV